MRTKAPALAQQAADFSQHARGSLAAWDHAADSQNFLFGGNSAVENKPTMNTLTAQEMETILGGEDIADYAPPPPPFDPYDASEGYPPGTTFYGV